MLQLDQDSSMLISGNAWESSSTFSQAKGSKLTIYDVLFRVWTILVSARTSFSIGCLYQCNQSDSLAWLCDQESHKRRRWKFKFLSQKSIITQFLVTSLETKMRPCTSKNNREPHWEVSWAPDTCLHSLSPAVLNSLPL